jgi:hypothetical protein
LGAGFPWAQIARQLPVMLFRKSSRSRFIAMPDESVSFVDINGDKLKEVTVSLYSGRLALSRRFLSEDRCCGMLFLAASK